MFETDERGEGRKISAYNEGMLQIERLHYLWLDCNRLSRNGEIHSWRWDLDCIWRELSRDAAKKEKANIMDFMRWEEDLKWFRIHKELVFRAEEAKGKGRGFYAVSLSRLEIFLRYLQEIVGKGGKDKDPDEDRME